MNSSTMNRSQPPRSTHFFLRSTGQSAELSPLNRTGSSCRLSLTALTVALAFSCSSGFAAENTQAPEQVIAATNPAAAPLHEHSSVVPSSAMPATPEKPAPATVPEEAEAPPMPEQDNKIVIVNRPQVSGLWAMTIPGAKCLEYYNFMEKGDVVIKSSGEWTYGNYIYQVPNAADTGTPVLAMHIQYDNQQTDCSGNAVDQRGEDQQQYVKWTGPSTMEFCATEDGKQCFATLRRLLP